jgi:ribulose-5-phosphate 4-epimerase/fuculose-1-phosphate aldolase
MNEAFARDEICRIGKSLFDRGYVHSTAGNISAALDAVDGGGFLITPTDACLGFLNPATLARLDADLRQTSGDRASKTVLLHQQIYTTARALGQDVQCVLHSHSTHCVSVSLQPPAGPKRELLPPITPYFVMKVGHVPVLPYQRPGDPAVTRQVAQTMCDYADQALPIRAVMLARLGPVVWHSSPANAMATLEELEETARLWLLADPKPADMSDANIQELRDTCQAIW